MNLSQLMNTPHDATYFQFFCKKRRVYCNRKRNKKQHLAFLYVSSSHQRITFFKASLIAFSEVAMWMTHFLSVSVLASLSFRGWLRRPFQINLCAFNYLPTFLFPKNVFCIHFFLVIVLRATTVIDIPDTLHPQCEKRKLFRLILGDPRRRRLYCPTAVSKAPVMKSQWILQENASHME